jgi:galactokinase
VGDDSRTHDRDRRVTSTWAAPGRVNLVGEHVDYNDGLVLPFALPWTTTTRATRRDGGRVTVDSEGSGSVEFAVDVDPDDLTGWAGYVAGVIWALRRRGFEIPGYHLTIDSNVPLGAGLSSSAALTCSVAAAINDDRGFGLTPKDLADVARVAENDFVGVSTGVMDQLAAMLCRQGSALLVDCRSLDTRPVELGLADAGLRLLLINTEVKHELAGSEYGARRSDCEDAARELGLSALRDASAEQVSTLSNERLRRRAQHVVTEIARVSDVVALLDAGRPADIGPLLTASHHSLRDDYEVSSAELDATVDAALSAGALGARMVGGGFGGCAIALCKVGDDERVRGAVQETYDTRGWKAATITSPEPSEGAHKVS